MKECKKDKGSLNEPKKFFHFVCLDLICFSTHFLNLCFVDRRFGSELAKTATSLIPDMLSLLRRNKVENAEALLTDLVDQLTSQCFNNNDHPHTKKKGNKKDEWKILEESRTAAKTVGEIFVSANMHKVSLI